jgi:hypothetical protein
VWANSLFLKPCSAKVFLPFLQEHFPRLVPVYKKRYSRRAFVSPAYNRRISELVAKFRVKYGIAFGESRNERSTRLPANLRSGAQMGLFDGTTSAGFPVVGDRSSLPHGELAQKRLKAYS